MIGPLALTCVGMAMRFGRRDAMSVTAASTVANQRAWWSAPAAAADKRPYSWEAIAGVPGDNRNYALITLDNGVRGLVCCDEAYTRCELSVSVGCGSLDDPNEREGLAHLAEHVTLASDPASLQRFIDEREGDLNAFTGERSTSFYGQYQLGRRITRTPSATAATLAASAAMQDDVAEGCICFAALFARPTATPAVSVVSREVERVDAELPPIQARPSRSLVEVAALKARAADGSAWRRLGRGGKPTLLDPADPEARQLADAIVRLKAEWYVPQAICFAVVSPLSLAEAVPLVADAFARIPPAPASLASAVPLSQPGPKSPTTRLPSSPFPDLRFSSGGAMALQRPGRYPLLTLTWQLDMPLDGGAFSEACAKPLELVGHALTAPHAHSLASLLRDRNLSPLEVELEPVVTSKAVARADTWVLWQLELTLTPEGGSRWREAAGMAIGALERLRSASLPPSVVVETRARCESAWRWGARQPTAVELAADLQLAIPLRGGGPDAARADALAVAGPRTFVGTTEELCAAADAAAAQLASRSPLITVWAADPSSLGLDTSREGPPLPWPMGDTARLLPLRLTQSSRELSAAALKGIRTIDLRPPPTNPWLTSSFSPPSHSMARVGYRFGGTPTDDTIRGFGAVLLPGCVDRRTLMRLPGSGGGLTDAMCVRSSSGADMTRPFAVGVIEIASPLPARSNARQAARAELWRLTLLQAISDEISAAARVGLRCEISYNARGMRILVSGFAQRLPRLLILVLRRTLRHLAPPVGSAQLAAARRAALSAARARGQPPVVLDELQIATPERFQSELARFFGGVSGASLLLAGALSFEAAEALVPAVRREVEPLGAQLRVAAPAPDTRQAPLEAAIDLEGELERWAGLLYRPSYSAIAQNACLDPAIARALDQCGGV